MRSATDDDARKYCNQEDGVRKVAEDGTVYFDSPDEYCFLVKTPRDFREIAFLVRHLISGSPDGHLEGGLVWLKMWDIGAQYLKSLGWRIIENMRRANGDMRLLDLAPAQIFREDEMLDLQVFLVTVFGNGWSGCFVPNHGKFIVEFRSSHRLFFYCENADVLNRLYAEFKQFNPEMATKIPADE